MWLLVGLGNPGAAYARNRHNVGFMVVDTLAASLAVRSYKSRMGCDTAEAQIDQHKVILCKPMQFMNKSGGPVARVFSFHKISPEKLMVVHDDLDLELGQLRIKKGGGHGGHNGLRSILDELGTPDFIRVRCGVGRPIGNAAHAVLSDFHHEEKEAAITLIQEAVSATQDVIKTGLVFAMNRYNARKETKAVPDK